MADIKKQLRWSRLKVGSVITLALLDPFGNGFLCGKPGGILFKKGRSEDPLQGCERPEKRRAGVGLWDRGGVC